MSTKKKLIIAISAVSVTLLITLVTLIIVLVASTQLASSNVVVEYVATDVSATVSASYVVGNKTILMKNGDSSKLDFKPGKTTTGSLSADGFIELSPDSPTVVFEYVFTNSSTNANINVILTTTTSTSTNATISYAYSSTKITDYTSLATSDSYTTQVINANSTADATKYIYVIVSATNSDSDARCTGSFAWSLERA